MRQLRNTSVRPRGHRDRRFGGASAKQMAVRFDEAEFERIDALAKASQLPFAAIVRSLVAKALSDGGAA